MDKFIPLNIKNIPAATSISVYTCADPECGPHIVFWSGDRILAHAALTIELAVGVIEDMNDVIQMKVGPWQ